MKGPLKKLSPKTATRIGTSLVVLATSSILALTMWFIMKTLNEVAVAKTSNGSAQLRIEGVSSPLLEKAMLFKEEKSSETRKLGPNIPNPFSRPATPSSAPAPQPTPVTAPSPAPAPAQ